MAAIYNPFTGTGGRLGGVYTDPSPGRYSGVYGRGVVSKGGNGNIFGDVARAETSTPTAGGTALGYGQDGDTPEYRDNAWQRFVATLSPYLNANQIAYLNSQRGIYEDATRQAQANDPGAHFVDVLGNADVVRQVESASPFQVGGSARYVPTRFR